MSGHLSCFLLFFFKQTTAYEMRISDWSSDVCSSDLISSPNTPGLRDLQHGAALDELLAAAQEARGSTPLFLKVAPDLDLQAIDAIARAAIDRKSTRLNYSQ